jgi:hypothetical protein
VQASARGVTGTFTVADPVLVLVPFVPVPVHVYVSVWGCVVHGAVTASGEVDAEPPAEVTVMVVESKLLAFATVPVTVNAAPEYTVDGLAEQVTWASGVGGGSTVPLMGKSSPGRPLAKGLQVNV